MHQELLHDSNPDVWFIFNLHRESSFGMVQIRIWYLSDFRDEETCTGRRRGEGGGGGANSGKRQAHSAHGQMHGTTQGCEVRLGLAISKLQHKCGGVVVWRLRQ